MHYLVQFLNFYQEILVVNNIFKIVYPLIALVFTFALSPAYAEDNEDICKPAGYVVGFFNGVWNTKLQAEGGLSAIRDSLYGEEYNGETLEYELFYNQTGSDREGVTMLEDIAEVFQQRAQELDGALSNRWEIFWETLGSTSDEASFIDKISSKISNVSEEFKNLMGALYTDIATKSVAGWSYILSNPPTSVDYTTQHTRVKTLALEKKKLALVAHSQGNLFVNQAYDAALTITDSNSVKAIHIAPASPTLRGQHILADLDLVINGLRAQGLSSIPEINAELPASHLVTDDFSGHKLIETYLNSKRETYTKVKNEMKSVLDQLVTPYTEGNNGFFTVTLTWNGTGDVDLHTFEPSGSHVYYQSRQGTSGYLDVDNVVANGPEHYYASCEANILQEGTYRIGINNYADATGRAATVQVSTAKDGEVFSQNLGVGAERGADGDQSPIPVVNVLVTKDDENQFSATILNNN